MLAICWPGRLIRAGVGVIAGVVIVAAAAGGLLLVGGAAGQSGGDGDARPPTAAAGYDEAEAQAIDRMLMCPVCPAQTIDQTEVTLAQQMRAQVRELLAGGASRAETLDWFRERYGPGIVAEPPRSGFNLIAWLAPGAVVIIGLAGGVLAMRAMRRPAGDGVSGDGVISGAGGDTGAGLPVPGNATGGDGGGTRSGAGGDASAGRYRSDNAAGNGGARFGAGGDAGAGQYRSGNATGDGDGKGQSEADELLPWLDVVDRELELDGVLLDGIPSDDNPSGNEPPAVESPGNELPGGEAPSNELPAGESPGNEPPSNELPAGDAPGTEAPGREPAGEG